MACSQPEAQAFLAIFCSNDIHGAPDDMEISQHTVKPIMQLVKPLDEITDFHSLVVAIEQSEVDWDCVFVAGLKGEDDQLPPFEMAQVRIQSLIKDIQLSNITNLLAYDIKGKPVDLIKLFG